MASIQTQRVQAAASQLAEQLYTLHSTNFALTSSQEQDVLTRLNADCAFLLGSTDQKRVMEEAMRLWKLKTPPPSPPTTTTSKSGGSFSLFAQLQGAFAAPVTLEEIQEASSDEELLAVFEKVSHVEDLMMDWTEICPLLTAAMERESCQYFLAVVRKWFDQGRQSSEYLSFQYDLCQITIDHAIKLLYSESVTEEDKLVACMKLWRDMILDLMQTGKYSKQGMEKIEVSMLLLLRQIDSTTTEKNDDRNTDTNKLGYDQSNLAAYILAVIDPEALWFVSWAAHVSPEQMTKLLLDTQIVPELKRCCCIESNERIPRLLKQQAAEILATILQTLRVQSFPWGELERQPTRIVKSTMLDRQQVENDDGAAESAQETPKENDIRWVLSMLLRCLHATTDGSRHALRCDAAIKTVLSGIRVANADLFNTIRGGALKGEIDLSSNEKEQERIVMRLQTIIHELHGME